MPPKETPKKIAPTVIRASISDSSLFYVPDDFVEGYRERIETGIDWTLKELAARHHRKHCNEENIPILTFSEALKIKIKNSILGPFLDEKSSITLEQQWDLLPTTLWDNDKFANEESQICFRNANSITDDMVKMIKKAAQANDRKILGKEIKMVKVLRVIDSKMTSLDKGLKDFKKLIYLNLCGNYIDTVDPSVIPATVKSIELQANRIKSIEGCAQHLPHELLYLGLSGNFLNDASVEPLARLPPTITVLDLAENDIYDLELVLDALMQLPNLTSLTLAGNPCSVCAAYARTTLARLRHLQWLDYREVLPSDRTEEPFEPHPEDLRAAYFIFTVFRVMSAPQPPKPDKGAIATFHVELEIPLLDSSRRQFLMYRRNESLQELMQPPEDGWSEAHGHKRHHTNDAKSKHRSGHGIVPQTSLEETSSLGSDIYKFLTTKNSRMLYHYKTFESNRVQWNKLMNFTEPTIRIFCPDLEALRNTFRTNITLRLVYSLTPVVKQGKDKKSTTSIKVAGEQHVVMATIKCTLRNFNWSQPSQHFHWDDSLGTNEAIHWGEGDLSVLQYNQVPAKVKVKTGDSNADSKQQLPDNLTCHFGFGIES